MKEFPPVRFDMSRDDGVIGVLNGVSRLVKALAVAYVDDRNPEFAQADRCGVNSRFNCKAMPQPLSGVPYGHAE
jgi:hypothetical protein